VEGRKGPNFDFRLGTLLGDALLGCHLYPKWVVNSWDHLMLAREVSEERPKSLSVQVRGERLTVEPNELEFVMEWVVEERECTGHAQM